VSGFGYLLFQNSSLAIRAEKLLRRAGIPARLAPAPRGFSSNCGLAVRCDPGALERARAQLAAAGVEIAAFHRI
jgi:hypothetical protein